MVKLSAKIYFQWTKAIYSKNFPSNFKTRPKMTASASVALDDSMSPLKTRELSLARDPKP